MTVQPTDVGGTIQHHNVGGSSATKGKKMFASKTPRDLNHDPEPWKVWLETAYAMHGHREWRGAADDWDDALPTTAERSAVPYGERLERVAVFGREVAS